MQRAFEMPSEAVSLHSSCAMAFSVFPLPRMSVGKLVLLAPPLVLGFNASLRRIRVGATVLISFVSSPVEKVIVAFDTPGLGRLKPLRQP